MKRIGRIIYILLCVVFLLPVSGCTDSSNGLKLLQDGTQEGGETKEIAFIGYKADAKDLVAIERVLRRFMRGSDTNVIYEGIESTVYFDVLKRRANAGVLADMFMVDAQCAQSFGRSGLLTDLSDLEELSAFGKLAKDQFMRSDGTVLFIPSNIRIAGLYVNRTLLKKHGKKVPETYEQLSEQCEYFLKRNVTPIVANAVSCRAVATAVGMMDVYQKSDSAAAVRALNADVAEVKDRLYSGVRFVDGMIGGGMMSTDELSKSDDEIAENFAAGKRPFMIAGSALMRTLKSSASFDYGIYPIPVSGGAAVVADVGSCISINAAGKEIAAARSFIKYLTTPDVLWEYCDSQGGLSPLEGAKLPSQKALHPSAAAFKKGQYVIGEDFNITLPVCAALDAAVAELIKGGSAEDACTALQTLIDGGAK